MYCVVFVVCWVFVFKVQETVQRKYLLTFWGTSIGSDPLSPRDASARAATCKCGIDDLWRFGVGTELPNGATGWLDGVMRVCTRPNG